MRFHSFDDVQDHLDALGLFHMDFGLDRVRNALDALGLLTPPFVTVQIVGTNGKGSTSTFLSCVARAHGLKVGLYTSPHFVTPRERIRINGTMLPADRWPVLADRVMEAAPNLTYFEFLTALGLLAFAGAMGGASLRTVWARRFPVRSGRRRPKAGSERGCSCFFLRKVWEDAFTVGRLFPPALMPHPAG